MKVLNFARNVSLSNASKRKISYQLDRALDSAESVLMTRANRLLTKHGTPNVQLSLPRSLEFHECHCACHKVQRWTFPKYFKKLLGNAHVEIFQACIGRCCQYPQRSRATISFAFPRWILSRMLYIDYISRQGTVPETGAAFTLRAFRIIPADSGIFQAIRSHQSPERIMQLMHMGLCSPFDVDPEGNTPLHVRRF